MKIPGRRQQPPETRPPNYRVKQKTPTDTRRRNTLLAAAGLGLAALMMAASILTYSRADEAIVSRLSFLDIARIPFEEGVRESAAGIDNGLGLAGALTADLLINGTIGYGSIVFPLLILYWTWLLVTGGVARRALIITNYALIIPMLLAAAAGVVGLAAGGIGNEWSGLMGAFAADILASVLGLVGASVLILAALAVTIALAIELDMDKSLRRAREITAMLKERIRVWRARAGAAGDSRPGNSQPQARTPERVAVRTSPAAAGRSAYDTRNQEDRPDQRDQHAEIEADDLPSGDESVAEDVPEDRTANEDDGAGQAVSPDSGPVPIVIERRAGGGDAGADGEGDEEGESAAGSDRGGRHDADGVSGYAEQDYELPPPDLLDPPRHAEVVDREEMEANAELLRAKLAHFGVEIESVSVIPGPVITLYELVPATGVKISKIVSLTDDLALALAAKGIRIMAPIPGKSAVGVEIPNRNSAVVSLRSVLATSKFREYRGHLPIALGKGISGEVIVDDLSKMPHLLIAGATGSGKSVGINTLIASILYRLKPHEVKFILIDPKKIEMTQYARMKHHYLAVSPDIQKEIFTTPEEAVGVLKSVELEMEKRYDTLALAGVRSIQDYNERARAGRLRTAEGAKADPLPYLIVVIDELADLMLTAAREVEDPIARLAQLARAVGIHLVLATQRPSVDVITGVIKANFPARIAFQVSSKIDSRTILDMNGAEQLLGSGDMLYLPAGSPKPIRIQNAFISSDEVERLTAHIDRMPGYPRPFMLPSVIERKRAGARGGSSQRDELFDDAARLIVRHQQGSVSLLQRRLKVGYSRAARLVDELESAGIVGPYDGSKARDVLVETEEQLESLLTGER